MTPRRVLRSEAARSTETRSAARPHRMAGRTRRYREILPKLSSEYGIERAHDPQTAHLRFNQIVRPRCAEKRQQRNPASLCAPRHHHARNGICRYTRTHEAGRTFVLPEYAKLLKQHAGQVSARISRLIPTKSRPNSCAEKSPPDARLSPPTSTTPNSNR